MSHTLKEKMVLARKRDRVDLSLKLFVLGMNILFLHQVLRSLNIMHMVIAYTGYFILFFSLLWALQEGKLGYLRRGYVNWLLSIWFFAAFMLFYGIILQHELRYISHDIWPFTYFAALLVAAKKDTWKTIDRMIYFHFTAAIAAVLYIWFTYYGFAITREKMMLINIAREVPSLYYAWDLLFGWPYMLLTYRGSSLLRRAITVFGIGMLLLLALVFEKRFPFVQFALLMFLIMLFPIKLPEGSSTRRVWGSRAGSLGLVMLLSLVAFQVVGSIQKGSGVSYTTRLLDRFTLEGSIIDTVLADDRLSGAPKLVLQQAESHEILLGQGLGSTVWRPQGLSTTIESGLFAFFLKGGIIYTTLWYLGLLGPIRNLLIRRKSEIRVFRLLVTFVVLLTPIATIFNAYPSTGYTMLWLGRCTARKSYKRRKASAGCSSFAKSDCRIEQEGR